MITCFEVRGISLPNGRTHFIICFARVEGLVRNVGNYHVMPLLLASGGHCFVLDSVTDLL